MGGAWVAGTEVAGTEVAGAEVAGCPGFPDSFGPRVGVRIEGDPPLTVGVELAVPVTAIGAPEESIATGRSGISAIW